MGEMGMLKGTGDVEHFLTIIESLGGSILGEMKSLSKSLMDDASNCDDSGNAYPFKVLTSVLPVMDDPSQVIYVGRDWLDRFDICIDKPASLFFKGISSDLSNLFKSLLSQDVIVDIYDCKFDDAEWAGVEISFPDQYKTINVKLSISFRNRLYNFVADMTYDREDIGTGFNIAYDQPLEQIPIMWGNSLVMKFDSYFAYILEDQQMSKRIYYMWSVFDEDDGSESVYCLVKPGVLESINFDESIFSYYQVQPVHKIYII